MPKIRKKHDCAQTLFEKAFRYIHGYEMSIPLTCYCCIRLLLNETTLKLFMNLTIHCRLFHLTDPMFTIRAMLDQVPTASYHFRSW